MRTTIRRAQPSDAPLLADIEADAAEAYIAVPGLEWLAEAPVGAGERDVPRIAAGLVWISEIESRPCGFLASRLEVPDLHVVEVSVRRAFQRRGVARSLIEVAAHKARETGLAALTLTTFRDLAWNEPFYAKLGFIALDDNEIDPRLRSELTRDAASGLPADRRCAMRLRLR